MKNYKNKHYFIGKHGFANTYVYRKYHPFKLKYRLGKIWVIEITWFLWGFNVGYWTKKARKK